MNDDKDETLNACKKYLRFFFKIWITGYKESFISNLTFMKKSIYKYGWEYSIDDKQILAIIPKPDSQKPIPKSLFKYYKLDLLSFDALSKCYIYAPHSEQLNYPVDCNHALVIFDDPRFVYTFLKPIQPEKSFEEIRRKVEQQDYDLISTVQYNIKQILYARMGIISLCENHASM